MAICRVYLFTYKRNHLLKRAISALLAQTFSDWVCELHNDCPEDTFPREYVTGLNDDRFIIKDHQTNMGGTKSFNLAFAGCGEKYASILEDDNWWEPGFLETMTGIMDQNPDLSIAWSNMMVWRESVDGQWKNTGKKIWDDLKQDKVFPWPGERPAMAALHSNGAMIYKGAEAANYVIPGNCEFSIIEPVRERLFKLPLYLAAAPLANFSLTVDSGRSDKSHIWTACQAMLLGSFLEAANDPQQKFKQTLAAYRVQKPSPLPNFFVAVQFLLKNPLLFKFFTAGDWFIVSKWLIKNLSNLVEIKSYLKSQQNVYTFLKDNTIAAEKENAR